MCWLGGSFVWYLGDGGNGVEIYWGYCGLFGVYVGSILVVA